jgi:hypothetical protein
MGRPSGRPFLLDMILREDRPLHRPRFRWTVLLACGAVLAAGASRVSADPLPTVAKKTEGLERRTGLLPVYVDRQRGRLWLELPAKSDENGVLGRYLYVEGITTGMGSNPVGLDRGQIGATQVVALRRVGGRLVIEAGNQRFRALTDNAAEAAAIRQSFAGSVLWGGEIAAQDDDGRALVDLTSFLVRDAHGISRTLRAADQGSYALDEARSALDLSQCLSFSENLEFEALLTYTGNEPGPEMRAVLPDPGALTLVQHHSLIRLPDDGYRPRTFDPRSSSYAVSFLDYGAPVADELVTKWIVRYRLEKLDARSARSRVKKPIVYYVDPGAPEPIRQALIEGASWWAKAFDAAGFIDAFRVELLPPGAHPLDVRYNVIQWVPRATRGWSYGGGVIDPRTGEMLKGHVTLDSLRIRQDRLLVEGLVGTEKTGTGSPDDPVQIALARIRQLTAHEVGHTLGFAHNFAASSWGRASVMDYPAPQVDITPGGTLDLSHAYASGVGAWDFQSTRFAYSEFARGTDEGEQLEAILREGTSTGQRFLSDRDARPPGAANPFAALWDNGPDPVEGLRHELAVRRIALANFGEHNVRPGVPLSRLQDVLAPVYFHHRYELTRAATAVGGLDYAYNVRGDGQPPSHPVAGATQRAALKAILAVLTPENLDLPELVLAVLLPRAFEQDDDVEDFRHATSPVFDSLGAAGTAARMTVEALLQRERASRLVDLHRRDDALPGLEDVLDGLVDTAFAAPGPQGERRAELRRVVQQAVVNGMIRLAEDGEAPARVRFRVDAALRTLSRSLPSEPGATPGEQAHRDALRREIEGHLSRPRDAAPAPPAALAPPPGDPIGDFATLGECGLGDGGFSTAGANPAWPGRAAR